MRLRFLDWRTNYMKRALSLLIIFIVALLLLGCKHTNTRLNPPVNLRIQDNVLYWDSVPNATGYEVYINLVKYDIEINQFNLDFLTPGTYEIRVKAISTIHQPSYLSSPLNHTVEPNILVPKNLKISESVLTWDIIDNTTGYIVLINDRTYEVNDNHFDLSFLAENHFYNISVKALYGNKESEYSQVIVYHTFFTTYKNLLVLFYRDREEDLIVDFSEKLNVYIITNDNEEVIDAAYYELSPNTLTIYNTYLVSLDYGLYKYVLFTSLGKVNLEIKITNSLDPYIISDNNVTFNNEDLEFEFELFGGIIDSITITKGLEITEADYRIEGSKLIIKSSFVDNLFTENSDRKRLIVSYTLRKDDKIVIGFIFIKKPN